jgi:choline monooxygenase
MPESRRPAVESRIHGAETPPAALYTDPALFERIRERVFARSWQLVGDLESVRVPGQVSPVALLEGCLDEPLLLTRDAGDRLHCLSNVCTHRGMLVAETAGVLAGLRCRYHGRRFTLDGRFVSMPEFQDAEDFPRPCDDLPSLPLEPFRPWLFASLDPDVSFAELVGPVAARVGHLPLARATLDPARSRDYVVRANWALYCDNYLEGFHIPFVHAGLAGALDYASCRTELFAHANLQVGVASDTDALVPVAPETVDNGQRIAAYYFWLFPNTMLNVYPWGVSVNIVKPLAVDRTRVTFRSYVWAPELLEAGAGADLDRVEREDEVVVEAVQRGLRGRLYGRGRYSPSREAGVHHFHRLLYERLGEPAGA